MPEVVTPGFESKQMLLASILHMKKYIRKTRMRCPLVERSAGIANWLAREPRNQLTQRAAVTEHL